MIIRPADSDDWPPIYRFFAAIVAAGETYAWYGYVGLHVRYRRL